MPAVSPDGVRLLLVVIQGPTQARRLAIPARGHVVIGRDPKCSMPLDDDALSLRQCAIEALPDRPDCVVVTDLMTGGGTRVNGESIMQRVLRPGDRLQIGDTVLELQPRRPSPNSASASSASGRATRAISTRALRVGLTVTQSVRNNDDVETAAAALLQLGLDAGFSEERATALANATREVATNAVVHAEGGEVTARRTRRGVRVEVWDTGPGLPMDMLQAIHSGDDFQLPQTAQSSWGNQTGLHAVRELIDQLSVISLPGNTQVIMEMFLSQQ